MLRSNSLKYYSLSTENSSKLADRVVEFCENFSDEEDFKKSYQPFIEWISNDTLQKMREVLENGEEIKYSYEEGTYILKLLLNTNPYLFSLFWHDEDDLESMKENLIQDLSKEPSTA